VNWIAAIPPVVGDAILSVILGVLVLNIIGIQHPNKRRADETQELAKNAFITTATARGDGDG